MKIGILGGTFNPIHNGHVYMAYESIDKLNLDRVYFLPNFIPPHKDSMDRDVKNSVDMINLVVEEHNKFYISYYEIDKRGTSFTYETTRYFKNIFPNDDLYFLIGEDSYVDFSKWVNPELILEYVTLVVFERKFYSENKRKEAHKFIEKLGKKEILLDSLTLEISSNDIRERVRLNKNVSFLIPSSVDKYIKDNNLYKGLNNMLNSEKLSLEKIMNYLKENISEKRISHSQRVLDEMIKMSKVYDIDIEEAKIAALFHDSFKEKSTKYLISYISKYEVVPKYEEEMKINLHGIAASLFLYNEIGFKNNNVCNAIRYHTTGRANMSKLEMCLYLADVIEEERDFPGIGSIRYMSRLSLEEGMLSALNESIKFLINSNKKIHLDTVKSRNYFNSLLKKG